MALSQQGETQEGPLKSPLQGTFLEECAAGFAINSDPKSSFNQTTGIRGLGLLQRDHNQLL